MSLLASLLSQADIVIDIGTKVVTVAAAISTVIPNKRVSGALGIARTALDWAALNVGFAKNRVPDAVLPPVIADTATSVAPQVNEKD